MRALAASASAAVDVDAGGLDHEPPLASPTAWTEARMAETEGGGVAGGAGAGTTAGAPADNNEASYLDAFEPPAMTTTDAAPPSPVVTIFTG